MNIILIGMPGAGKSTIGVILAKTLGKNFIDTDLLIQDQEKRLLQEILNEDGTAAFLKIEENVLMTMSPEDSVIATGGSAVYSKAAMKHLKNIGVVVYLKLPYEEIKNRLSNITTRGVVMSGGQSLYDVFRERIPLYEKYADLVLDCEGRSVEQTVTEIAERVTAAASNV
jgi:shikimate kinase